MPVVEKLPSRRVHVPARETGSHHASGTGLRGRIRELRIAARHNRQPHAAEQRRFFLQHAIEITQPLEMFFTDRRDHGDVRFTDVAQLCDLAGRVRTHLDDRDIRMGRYREQGERNTDQVVVVRRRCVHGEPR